MMEVLEKINKGLIIEGAVTLGKKIMRRNLPFDIYKYITPNSWRSITEITFYRLQNANRKMIFPILLHGLV